MNRLSFKGLEGKQRAKKRERAVALFVLVFLVFVLALLGWGLLDFFGLSVAKASWPSCDDSWTETENQNIGSYEECGCAFMSCSAGLGSYDCASADSCTRECRETGSGPGYYCYSSCDPWDCSSTTLYSGWSCGCGSGGCRSDADCAPDDGCTDYYCDEPYCQSTDLCGGGGGGGTPTPTPGGNPYFNVDIVQASGTVSIEQGQVATYDVNITPFNNYSGAVNLSVSGCPATATCAFSAGSVTFTNDSPNPGTSVLIVSNTANVTPNTYSLIVTGTDTAPDPDLTGSDSSDLTLRLSSLAICDSTWRDIPSVVSYVSSFAAAQDNSGVYRYSPLQWTAWPYYSGGLTQDKCTFGAGSGVCLWQSSRLGQDDFTGYSVYAQDANNIFLRGGWGYFSGYGLTVTSESVLKFSPPSSWTDMGDIPELWGTPTSVTDKDGRLWNFQYLDYPFYKSQYRCGASPNQAICDGTWRQTPGGGNTPSQPVGTNVQAGLSVSPLSPSVGLVIRGTDNQVYYRNCIFSGSECLWNGWSGLGGSTLYSPYTFTGDGWDVIMKNADNNSWAKVDWWWGWDANWSNRGASWESWGGLYRFNDVKGRTWQLRRNADTTISYACGANVCILPAFDSSKSSVSPITINVNDNVNIRCDMSVRDADFISPSFTGASNCVFNGYDVTTALFTCKATQAGINIPVNCNTSNIPPPGSNFCASSSTIGTLTVAVVNQPPTVPNVTVTEPDYCSSGPAVYVNWTYSDPDGDPQSAYQVQIDDQGSFNSPEVDSGKVSSSGTSYFASGLAFDITYKARVRVWDSNDNVSAWKDSGSWKTPKHAYPLVDFTYSPSTDIPAKQPVQFTDQTTFYDGGGGTRTWSWLFGDSGTSTQQNQSHTYNLPGFYQASLTATDKDGFSCSRTKPITIQLPVPVWKEVSPK